MGIFCYQHHINDWRRDTAHLSILHRGVYREILDWYYVTEGKIPNNTKQIARLIGAESRQEKEAIKYIVNNFFCTNSAGFLQQTRAEKEILHIKGKQKKASESAKIKYLACANAEQTHSERSANHQPITNNQIDQIRSTKKSEEKRKGKMVSNKALVEASVLANKHGVDGGIELGLELEGIFLGWIKEQPRNPDAAFLSWANGYINKHQGA